jgi:hypothetical protein
MSESEVISRRKALSILGLAAVSSLVAAPTVLTVSDAEAQQPATGTTPPAGGTPGTTRRQERRTERTERRQGRREQRHERRTERHERRHERRTGRTERRQERRGTSTTPQ